MIVDYRRMMPPLERARVESHRARVRSMHSELEARRKADPEKLKIAARLRAETTVTLKWIAHHLNMGAPGYLSDCLRTARI